MKMNISGNSRQAFLIKLILILLCPVFCFDACASKEVEEKAAAGSRGAKGGQMINLPAPELKGAVSVGEALAKRESVRQFSTAPLAPQQLSQLLWAAQGVTRKWGGRTAPSAGALYPLEVYLATRDGLFHYVPSGHRLMQISDKNPLPVIAAAALGQSAVLEAPAVFVICAVYERTSGKYRDRAERYVKIEVGHAAQNILLQAFAMGLGAVPIGAFDDRMIQQSLQLHPDRQPLYIIPVGHYK
jgi:SagB-type dehydrogenase family enzyme